MAKKKYDEGNVVRVLNSRSGIKVHIGSKPRIVEVDINAIVGIHTWGKIDYLCHYCGYVLHKVNMAEKSVKVNKSKKVKKNEKKG